MCGTGFRTSSQAIAHSAIGRADERTRGPPRTYGCSVFTPTQRDEVRRAFDRLSFGGELVTAPVDSEDERVFLLARADLDRLGDVRALEEELQRILRRKVWVAQRTNQWGDPVPFQ